MNNFSKDKVNFILLSDIVDDILNSKDSCAKNKLISKISAFINSIYDAETDIATLDIVKSIRIRIDSADLLLGNYDITQVLKEVRSFEYTELFHIQDLKNVSKYYDICKKFLSSYGEMRVVKNGMHNDYIVSCIAYDLKNLKGKDNSYILFNMVRECVVYHTLWNTCGTKTLMLRSGDTEYKIADILDKMHSQFINEFSKYTELDTIIPNNPVKTSVEELLAIGEDFNKFFKDPDNFLKTAKDTIRLRGAIEPTESEFLRIYSRSLQYNMYTFYTYAKKDVLNTVIKVREYVNLYSYSTFLEGLKNKIQLHKLGIEESDFTKFRDFVDNLEAYGLVTFEEAFKLKKLLEEV